MTPDWQSFVLSSDPDPAPWRPIGLTWTHVVIAIALVLAMVAVAVATVIWGPWALVVPLFAVCVAAGVLCWRAS
jgi:hypothetical protein